MRSTFSLLLTLSIILATGCRSSTETQILTSLDDMGSQFEDRGRKLPQSRVLTVHGISPVHSVGHLYHMKPKRGSVMGIEVSPNKTSYILVKDYSSQKATGGTNDEALRHALVQIKSELTKAHVNAIAAMVAKARAVELQYEENAPPSEVQVQRERADTARAEFDAAYVKILDILRSHPNIIIYRWTSSSTASAGLKFLPILDSSAKHTESESGYGILADVREESLVVGSDLTNALAPMVDSSKKVKNRMAITTYNLSARHVSWFTMQELQEELYANLKLDPKELSHAGSYLRKIDELELNFYLGRLNSLSNIGYRQAPLVTQKSIDWTSHMHTADGVAESENGYVPIYVVFSEAKDLLLLHRSEAASE